MDKKQLIISIITVTYNCRDTIDKTIKSVVGQKNSVFEYIIVDGGSTDGTLDIIKKYEGKIDTLISEPDNGIYNAMNKGINVAKGDYIYFLNGDDYLLTDRIICEVCEEIEKYKPDLFSARVGDEFGTTTKHNEKEVCEELIYHAMLPHQGLFTKKKVFEEIGVFDESYRIAADYEWMLRAQVKGYKFYYSDLIVAYYSPFGRSKCDIGIIEQSLISREYIRKYGNDINKKIGKRKTSNSIRLWIIKKAFIEYEDDIVRLITSFVPENSEIALFGAGRWGRRIYDAFEAVNLHHRITHVFDNNISDRLIDRWKEKGIIVEPFNKEIECYTLVSVERGQREILDLLKKNSKTKKDDYCSFDEICNMIMEFAVMEKNMDIPFVKSGCIDRKELLS